MTSNPPEPESADGAPSVRNPFVGPRPYRPGERLFGRLKEIRELYYLLSAERIVWLHSPSGAGKTSLIAAGLVPRFAQTGFRIFADIRVNLDLPQLTGAPSAADGANRYLVSLLLSLEESLPPDRRLPLESLAPLRLADYLAERLASGGDAPAGILLIFDQFEEILTLDPLDREAKRAFFEALGEALRDERLWALFALREEYLPQLEPFIDRIPTGWSNTFRLELLGQAATFEVLQRTAALGGRTFADSAVAALFADLAQTRIQQPDGSFVETCGTHVEPVQLQVVCRRLWDAMPADDRQIDPEDLSRFGNVSQALGAYYDDALARIAGTGGAGGDLAMERRIREWIGNRLITASGIRAQTLRGAETRDGLTPGAIAQLLDSHLVRGEKRAGATWYELAHDRLLQPISDSNRAWLERHLHPLQRRALGWVAQGRPTKDGAHVLRGADLREARLFERAHPERLTEDERELIALSASIRRTRLWVRAGLAIIVLLSLAFGATAYWLKLRAERQLAENYMSAAVRERERDPLKAAQDFARAAERFASAWEPGKSADARLASKLVLNGPSLQVVVGDDAPEGLAAGRPVTGGAIPCPDESCALTWREDSPVVKLWNSFTGELVVAPLKHDGPVSGAALSADASRVLTWSQDGTARLWDSRTGALVIPPLKHGGPVGSAELSADGSRILARTKDNAVRLWDSRNGADLTPLLKNDAPARSVQFSPDGSRIIALCDDDALQLWDSRTGAAVGPPLKIDKLSGARPTSPDGSRILAWSWSGTARLWDARSSEPLVPPLAHRKAVQGALVSADGQRILTWSNDGTARVWDSHSGAPLVPPLEHGKPVGGGQLSHDGSRILTWSIDDTAQVWDGNTGKPLAPPLTVGSGIRDARFSPDESRVLAWSEDGNVRIWDSRTGEPLFFPLRHGGSVDQAWLGADGSRLLTWSADGAARVWTIPSRRAERLRLQDLDSWDAAFDADGSRVLTWSKSGGSDRPPDSTDRKGSVRLWSAATGEPMTPPFADAARIEHAAFGADESKILAWSRDGSVRLWSSRTGEPLTETLKLEHEGGLRYAELSHDGSRILTSGLDETVRLWDSRTGQPVLGPLRHNGGISHGFSPDGRRILTVSMEEGTAHVWDCATGKELFPPLKHGDELADAEFSGDGIRILTWDVDGDVKLWNAANGLLLTRKLARDEREIRLASLSPDANRILTYDDDAIRVWHAPTGQLLSPPLKYRGRGDSAEIGPDAKRVLTWRQGGNVELWDGDSGTLLNAADYRPSVQTARLARDGKSVKILSGDGTLVVWDLAIDKDWPTDKIVLGTEVETGTELTATGEVEALSAAEWRRKRYCDWDAIRNSLGRLDRNAWRASQRLCRKSKLGPDTAPKHGGALVSTTGSEAR